MKAFNMTDYPLMAEMFKLLTPHQREIRDMLIFGDVPKKIIRSRLRIPAAWEYLR